MSIIDQLPIRVMTSLSTIENEVAETVEDLGHRMVIWDATLHVNPSLLAPIGLDASLLNVCLGETAELTGILLLREMNISVDQLEPTPVTMNLASICQTCTVPSIYRTGICSDVVTIPEATLATEFFNTVLGSSKMGGCGHSQYALVLHVTSQARLRWTTAGKIGLNPFDHIETTVIKANTQLPHELLVYATLDHNTAESSLCIKAEWLRNYDEFVNLCDYDNSALSLLSSSAQTEIECILNGNESINTLALFNSWWNQIPGSKLANNSAHGQTESSLSIDGLAEYLYLEHVSAEIDNQVANAARTPISIRKRLSKRDRTLMQRLTDSPARTGAAAPNSAILSGKKSVKTTVKPALPSKQSAIDKANAENIKNSNHKAMKKVVLLELRTIGIDRHHTDFNKYWSILYPGVKLALDDVVCKRLLTTEELRKNVEGHLRLLQKVR